MLAQLSVCYPIGESLLVVAFGCTTQFLPCVHKVSLPKIQNSTEVNIGVMIPVCPFASSAHSVSPGQGLDGVPDRSAARCDVDDEGPLLYIGGLKCKHDQLDNCARYRSRRKSYPTTRIRGLWKRVANGCGMFHNHNADIATYLHAHARESRTLKAPPTTSTYFLQNRRSPFIVGVQDMAASLVRPNRSERR